MMFLGCASVFVDRRINITFVGVAFTWTMAVVAMGYTFGHISGCHMNPAVTIAFASARQFPWKQVPFYIVSQVTGLITACLMLSWLFNGEETRLLMTLPGEHNPVISNLQAMTWEIIISSILMLVIRSAGTDPRASTQVGGIAVGAVLFSNIIVAGKITGASMNPARSLGPAIIAGNFNKIWIYMISPIVGTVIGSSLYNFFKIPKIHENKELSTMRAANPEEDAFLNGHVGNDARLNFKLTNGVALFQSYGSVILPE
ncbi:Aquaporin NIP1-1 [Platanthera zijinensis]|uniref:Aquaporin NIP1-1 n=1 Tax=Platanthera zijinensis TaxID=2320716 RepID=A0AAP0B931_9ASPA